MGSISPVLNVLHGDGPGINLSLDLLNLLELHIDHLQHLGHTCLTSAVAQCTSIATNLKADNT